MRACGKIKWNMWVGRVFVVLVGCMPAPKPARTPQELAKEYAPIPDSRLPMPEEGSLWVESTSVNPYSDVKARRVGDIVTISVFESAQASKKATTKTTRIAAV